MVNLSFQGRWSGTRLLHLSTPEQQVRQAPRQRPPQFSWGAPVSPAQGMAEGAAASRQAAAWGQAGALTPAGQKQDEPKAHVLATL